MTTLIQKIENIDWEKVTEDMHQNGYAIIPGLIDNKSCEELKAGYEKAGAYRKRVIMERHRFGLGEYKYYSEYKNQYLSIFGSNCEYMV